MEKVLIRAKGTQVQALSVTVLKAELIKLKEQGHEELDEAIRLCDRVIAGEDGPEHADELFKLIGE